ncbi:protein OSCP1a isoform X6 [Hypomesus transpacificus]|uniref:protein OSCP1a isoform X6 n=1 Tax=Hypomesus transpacificus TaxID=137520 RepID=UPI001F083724|nr:protein OSCP1a isoform X6 [Hypomesus transpacificus]
MSMKTLPLLFINLGGEMLYILDQRLRAQNTSDDNTHKVINDIISTMFNKGFMEELLMPQEVYSHRALRTVLTRLAHASIMRLNPASMDRLYELMVMAFKYQILLCPRPRDLLLISYNHMDALREFVKDTPIIANQVDETHRKIIEVYTPLSESEFQLLRQTLLIFFQDMHVRVSLFLNNKVQNPNGHFALPPSGPVPQGSEVPGVIRVFNSRGKEMRRWKFPTGGSYTNPPQEGSFELFGNRVIRLGTNMYSVTQPDATPTSKSSSLKSLTGCGYAVVLQDSSAPNPLAQEELNLLAHLMGGMEVESLVPSEISFRVNLFSSDQEEEQASASGEGVDSLFEVIRIQATQDVQTNTELARIAEEFAEEGSQSEGPSSKGDDLLAMMDEL